MKDQNQILHFIPKFRHGKKVNDCIYQLAEDKNGHIYTDNESIIRIATNFYKRLYTSEKVNEKVQHNLLRNIKTKLSKDQKSNLDKPITREEVFDAIKKLPTVKSPSLDGFPVEFYKRYWGKIGDLFLAYLCEVKENGFPATRNVSILKLIYKKTGEVYLSLIHISEPTRPY